MGSWAVRVAPQKSLQQVFLLTKNAKDVTPVAAALHEERPEGPSSHITDT